MNIYKKIRNLTFKNTRLKFPIASNPFISGDSFKLISDIVYYDNRKFNIGDNKNIIFSDINSLEYLESDLHLYSDKTIIIHNGDLPPSDLLREKIFNINSKLYSVNIKKKFSNENVIPIGIENYHYSNNGSLHYYNTNLFNKNFLFHKDNLILLSFNVNTNHNHRLKYKRIGESYGIKFIFPVDNDKYRNKLIKSKFVICPPGNGIDTHRFWEAIYHQTIPVVESQFYLFPHLNLPVYVVDDIEDFFKLSDYKKNEIANELSKKMYCNPIYMNYWIKEIYGNN